MRLDTAKPRGHLLELQAVQAQRMWMYQSDPCQRMPLPDGLAETTQRNIERCTDAARPCIGASRSTYASQLERPG